MPSATRKGSLPSHAVYIPTYRSGEACEHTDLWRLREDELATGEVISMLHDLKRCVVRSISLEGGEPLSRHDIGEVLSVCRGLGMTSALRTDGLLVQERIDEIACADRLLIDLIWDDGYPCGNARYEKSMRAVAAAMARGVDVVACVPLTKTNVSAIPAILADGRSVGVRMNFVRIERLGASADNSRLASIIPGRADLDEAMRLIALWRDKGAPVSCARAAGKALPGWRVPTPFRSFLITPSGRVAPGYAMLGDRLWPDGRRLGFPEAFDEALKWSRRAVRSGPSKP